MEKQRVNSAKSFWTRVPYIPAVLVLLVLAFVFIVPRGSGKPADSKKALPEGWMIINPPVQTTSLVEWKGEIVAGDSEGVYRIDLATGKVQEKYSQQVSMEYVKMLIVDSEDRLWVCHVNGVSVFDGREWVNYSKQDGLPDNRVNCVLQDKKGVIWVGTDGGAASFDGGKWKAFTVNNGLLVNVVNVMAEHDNGTMFFGSNVSPNGGVSCLYNGKWQYFTTDNGLPHNHVVVLYKDLDDGIWAGTGYLREGGACRFEFADGEWRVAEKLHKKDGLAGEKVCAIFEQQNGVMWLGSEYDGIAFKENGKWTVISLDQGLAGTEVKSVLNDSKGNLWFATPGGITKLEAGSVDRLLGKND